MLDVFPDTYGNNLSHIIGEINKMSAGEVKEQDNFPG